MSSTFTNTENLIRDRSCIPATSPIERLKSCLPVDAVVKDGKPMVEWLDMAGVVCSEPFFLATVDRVKKTSRMDQETTTDFDALIQLEKISDSLYPSGFIFHTSRSGSTLVSNACRALNDSLVISEAPIVPKIVGRLFTDTENDSTKELLYRVFLRGAISALGQRRLGTERHFFLKFTSTCFLQFNSFRKIWPRVPSLFLYRDPVEVMVSNLRTIPSWLRFESDPIVSALIIGVHPSELSAMSREEYCARALGRYYDAACATADDNTFFLDYEELTPQALLRIIRFFGVEPSPSEIEAIIQSTGRYSKDPDQQMSFQTDSTIKKAEASNEVKQAVERWAAPAYHRLQARAKRTAR
jgi:hypothetical protein